MQERSVRAQNGARSPVDVMFPRSFRAVYQPGADAVSSAASGAVTQWSMTTPFTAVEIAPEFPNPPSGDDAGKRTGGRPGGEGFVFTACLGGTKYTSTGPEATCTP